MSAHAGGRGGVRGWHYKQKYGGGGRSKRERGGGHDEEARQPHVQGVSTGSLEELRTLLHRIDGKGYGAYKDILGCWRSRGPAGFDLYVDHVQGDAYAAPSRLRVQVPAAVADLPPDLCSNPTRRRALSDYLTRTFGAAVARAGADARAQAGGWSGEKGGDMSVDAPGPYVLQRSSVVVAEDGGVEGRFTVGLPARGRTVLGQWAAQILTQNLPSVLRRYVQQGLHYSAQDHQAVARHVHCVEDTVALRDELQPMGLVAFVANGAVLPRESGASHAPMQSPPALPFSSPPTCEVCVPLPHAGPVKGMGIRAGVTLIVGGGFHGKSTLLNALEVGVYDKVPGDGRELVVCLEDAAKIRAEDGRQVGCVDISPFIANLPFWRPTHQFESADASGSTSQAANVMEALEAGARLLLIDEDTCATNFMVRDARMQALIAADKEPITPFVARVRSLVEQGVSTVLVVGGCGDYFDVADCVVAMDSYRAMDVTDKAKAIASQMPTASAPSAPVPVEPAPRMLRAVLPSADLRTQTRALGSISFGEVLLDLSCVEQLVDVSQTRALAEMVATVSRRVQGKGLLLTQVLDELEEAMQGPLGLDALCGTRKLGTLARPRRLEMAAALNRLRSATFHQRRSS